MKDQPYPYIDLRVDEHPDPVVELRRIYEVVKVQMLPFIEALPTRRNPKGDLGEEIRGALIPELSSPLPLWRLKRPVISTSLGARPRAPRRRNPPPPVPPP